MNEMITISLPYWMAFALVFLIALNIVLDVWLRFSKTKVDKEYERLGRTYAVSLLDHEKEMEQPK